MQSNRRVYRLILNTHAIEFCQLPSGPGEETLIITLGIERPPSAAVIGNLGELLFPLTVVCHCREGLFRHLAR